MKNLNIYIKESEYDNAPDNVKYAKNITEPIVIKALEKKGYTIKKSTRNDDFSGIDIIAVSKKDNKDIYIDVKCSKKENQNTPNFAFPIVSSIGTSYKSKKTDYVAFIDIPKKFIVFISMSDLEELINEPGVRKLKMKGEFALIKKDKVYSKGSKISIKDILEESS